MGGILGRGNHTSSFGPLQQLPAKGYWLVLDDIIGETLTLHGIAIDCDKSDVHDDVIDIPFKTFILATSVCFKELLNTIFVHFDTRN